MARDFTQLPICNPDGSELHRGEAADAGSRAPHLAQADWNVVAMPAGALADDRSDGPVITLPPDTPPTAKLSLVACPQLGISEDPASHYMVPDEAHHCFGLKRHARIPRAQQATTCLAPAYGSCVIFVAVQRGEPATPPWGERRRRSELGWLGRVFRKK